MTPSLGNPRESVKMEPRRRRGSVWCDKCHTYMEVYITYHKCPVCGRVQQKPGKTYKDRSADLGNRPQSLLERPRSSMQTGTQVSGTPGSAEFMDLEPRANLATLRRFSLGWLIIGQATFYLLLGLALEHNNPAVPLSSTALYLWIPLGLTLLAVIAIYHTNLRFRMYLLVLCSCLALGCLALATFSYGDFALGFYYVFPLLEHPDPKDWDGDPLFGMPASGVWLFLHGGWFALAALQIWLEERQLGRI